MPDHDCNAWGTAPRSKRRPNVGRLQYYKTLTPKLATRPRRHLHAPQPSPTHAGRPKTRPPRATNASRFQKPVAPNSRRARRRTQHSLRVGPQPGRHPDLHSMHLGHHQHVRPEGRRRRTGRPTHPSRPVAPRARSSPSLGLIMADELFAGHSLPRHWGLWTSFQERGPPVCPHLARPPPRLCAHPPSLVLNG